MRCLEPSPTRAFLAKISYARSTASVINGITFSYQNIDGYGSKTQRVPSFSTLLGFTVQDNAQYCQRISKHSSHRDGVLEN